MAEAHTEYRICLRCVMDTTDPDITLDGDGVCNHCHGFARRLADSVPAEGIREELFRRVVEEMRRAGRGKAYDCVIGLSGGVDSTMVAYLVRESGLRPLAVHVDNGWDAELAVNNIERCVKELGIDLRTEVLDWEQFRDIQASFLRASVPNIEIPTDHAIMSVMFKTCARHGIPYLVSGGNVVTEAIMPADWMYDAKDYRHIRALHRRFGSKSLRGFPHCGFFEYGYHVAIRRIRYVPLLNYTCYNREEAKRLLEQRLGWRDYGGKHHESLFTKLFQCHILPRKFGIDKRRAHLSAMILSGQCSREAALCELREPMYDPAEEKRDLEFFLKKMRISESEFAAMMAERPRRHQDYPSNARLLRGAKWFVPMVRRLTLPRVLRTSEQRSAAGG